MIGSTIAFNLIGRFFGLEIFLEHSTYLTGQDSIFVWPIAVILLIISLKKTYHSKIINTISSATFGVYLIHDNFLIRPFIWGTVFKCQEMIESKYIFIHAIVSVTIVYCVCTLIELTRQITVEKLLIKKLNQIESNFKFKKLRVKIGNKLKRAKFMNILK